MAGVAGANIANAQGRPIQAGTPWSTAVQQQPIGEYVQDATRPNGVTNYVGCNPLTGYATNAVGETMSNAFTCPTNDEAVAGGIGAWVTCAVALIPGDKVNISAGVATKDNTTGTHNVFANVPAGGYFWAVDVA